MTQANGPGTPSRKNSRDDSIFSTPVRPSLSGRLSLALPGSHSETSTLRDSERAWLDGGNATPISIVGSARRSMRGKNPRGIAEESISEQLTLEAIVFDDLKILNDDAASAEEKKDAHNRLDSIFSPTKGQPYIVHALAILDAKANTLIYEQRLSHLIKSTISSVISERKLWHEHCWKEFFISLIQKIIDQTKTHSASSSGQGICVEEIKTALDVEKNNGELYAFLIKKVDGNNLHSLLPNKSIKDLENILLEEKKQRLSRETRFSKIALDFMGRERYSTVDQACSAVHSLAVEHAENDAPLIKDDLVSYWFFKAKQEGLVEYATEFATLRQRHSQVVEANGHGFDSMSVSSYQALHLKEIFCFHREQEAKGAEVHNSNQPKSDAAAMNILEQYIVNHPQVDALKDLPNIPIVDLEKLYASYEKVDERISKQLFDIHEQKLEYADLIGETLATVKDHPQFVRKNVNTPARTAVINQAVDLFQEDEDDHKNVLEAALQCGDLLLIAKILAYAKHCNVLERLINKSLLKIAENENRQVFLSLIGGVYLFDPDNGGLFSATFVQKIREKTGGLFGGDTPTKGQPADFFSSLFDETNKPILTPEELEHINAELLTQADDRHLALLIKRADPKRWPDVHAEIKRRYLDNESAPEIPHEVWQALKERQNYCERFEKLTYFFENAVEHVVTQFKEDPGHYGEKASALLNKLSASAKDVGTLETEARNIANELAMPNSGISTWRHDYLPKFSWETKTQKLLRKAKDASTPSGQKVIVSTILTLTDNGDRTVSQEELKKFLTQTAGSIKDQEERQKRAVIARNAFKSTLRYLEAQCKGANSQAEVVPSKAQKISLEKKAIMDGLLNQYIEKTLSGAEFIAAFEAQLKSPVNAAQTTLMTKKTWWPFWSKSATCLLNDLKNNKEILRVDLVTNGA